LGEVFFCNILLTITKRYQNTKHLVIPLEMKRPPKASEMYRYNHSLLEALQINYTALLKIEPTWLNLPEAGDLAWTSLILLG
jgi:hypothetical protein